MASTREGGPKPGFAGLSGGPSVLVIAGLYESSIRCASSFQKISI